MCRLCVRNKNTWKEGPMGVWDLPSEALGAALIGCEMGQGSLGANKLCPSPQQDPVRSWETPRMTSTQSTEPRTMPEASLKIRTGLVIKYGPWVVRQGNPDLDQRCNIFPS